MTPKIASVDMIIGLDFAFARKKLQTLMSRCD
jgi:hypothetical protein